MVTLAGAFADRGYTVDLVLAQATGPRMSTVPGNVNVVDLKARRILTSIPGLSKYLRQARPVALLSALEPTNVVAIVARQFARVDTRVVISVHSMVRHSSTNAATWRMRLTPWWIRPIYPMADGVVAVSNGVADQLADMTTLSRGAIEVIYNPVAIGQIESAANEPVGHRWLENGSNPIILGAGRLEKEKDFSTLVKAFALFRETTVSRLIILGEGRERTALERLARAEGLDDDVDFPGYVGNPYAYMKAADVFVASSRWESFSLVLVEAMAVGTPVVATDAPTGPSEILQDGKFGLLVPPGDDRALASAIRRTLSSPTPSKALKCRAEDFRVSEAVRRYAGVLEI